MGVWTTAGNCTTPACGRNFRSAGSLGAEPDGVYGLARSECWYRTASKLIYAKGFGYADLENKRPTTPDTLCRIASHSKLFTATAIIRLRDQGNVWLDDPVEKHLKGFPISVTHPGAAAVLIARARS